MLSLAGIGVLVAGVIGVIFAIKATAVEPLATPKIYGATDSNTYEWFHDYRLKNFMPNSDSVYASKLAAKPPVKTDSLWVYGSYNSASIGFATDVPAVATIEYGENTLNQRTEVSESYFYNHLFHLKGLKEGSNYIYRILVQDSNGNLVVGETKTLTTKTFSGSEIKITNEYLEGLASYRTLMQNDAVYVLTEDIRSDDLGINLKANNTILDLNGFTITYDCGAPRVTGSSWNDYAYGEEASVGIRSGLWNKHDAKILNGSIKQCEGSMHKGSTGTGYNPILFTHFQNTNGTNEFAGLSLEWHANSTHGAMLPSGNIHHNVLKDTFVGSYCNHLDQVNTTCVVDNRHQQHKEMTVGGESTVAYNLILRARQGGIAGGKDVYENEVYMDSYVTNSFGIQASTNGDFHHNRVFGMGYAANGSAIGADTSAHDNLTIIYCYAPYRRYSEYDRDSAISGVRFTNYSTSTNTLSNVRYYDNTVILKAQDGCAQARGLWTVSGGQDSNNVFEGNTIKVEALAGNHGTERKDEFYPGYVNGVKLASVNNAVAAVALGGASWNGNNIERSMTFRNNHLISNVNIILAGEGYSNAGNVVFEENTIEKISANSEWFHWLRRGFWYWDSYDIRFINNKYVGFNGESEEPVNTSLNTACDRGEYETALMDRKVYRVVNQFGVPYVERDLKIMMKDDGTYATALKAAHNATTNLLNQEQTIKTDGAGAVTLEYAVKGFLCYGGTGEGGVKSTKFIVEPVDYVVQIGNLSAKFSLSELRGTDTLVINDPGAVEVVEGGDDLNEGGNDSNPDLEMPTELPQTGVEIFAVFPVAAMAVALTYYLQSRRQQ